jgi:hypothetical protein
VKVDRLLLKTMVKGSPKVQEKCQAAKLQLASQRVEDNAFHLDSFAD